MSESKEDYPDGLVQRLRSHIAMMAPHQKERMTGKLLLEATEEIRRLQAAHVGCTILLGLLADIRAAVGDPTGKLMQGELVEHCRKLAHSADWNRRRVAMLSRVQKHMRNPERQLVCDIIANCQLLPDPTGKRYGFATTGTEHYRPNSMNQRQQNQDEQDG